MQLSGVNSKFHGNINEHLSLTDVFETLVSKKRKGWLFLTDDQQELCLSFQGDMVGLVSVPEEKIQGILEKLYYFDKISSADYQKIKEKKETFQTFKKNLPVKEMNEILTTIAYDAICDLFAWKNAHFQFLDEDAIEKRNRQNPVGGMFSISGILMESAQRLDEWPRIWKALPSPNEIVLHKTASLPALESENSENQEALTLQDVWKLSSQRSVMEIIQFSRFSEFAVAKGLVSLYSEGHLRILTDDELLQQAKSFQNKQDPYNAIRYYKILYQRNPHDYEICDFLASCYLNANQVSDLKKLYETASDALLLSQNIADKTRGALYLKKLCELTPAGQNTEIQLRLLSLILHEEIKPAEIDYNIVKEGLSLAQTLENKNQREQAREIIKSLLPFTPNSVPLREKIISISAKINDTAEMLSQYETIASLYEEEGNLHKLELTYAKISELTPTHKKDISRKIQKVRSSQKERKYQTIKRAFIGCLILLGVYIVFLYNQHRIAYDNKREEIKRNIEKELENGLIEKAEELLKSDLLKSDEKYLFGQKIKLKQDQNDGQASSILQQANNAESDGNLKLAIELLEQASAVHPSSKIKEIISNKQKDILTLLKYMEQRLAEAKEFENSGNFSESGRIYLEIWQDTRFHITERNQIRLPLKVSVIPKGSTLEIDNEKYILNDQETLHFPPGFKNIKVSMQGYVPSFYYNAFGQKNATSPITDRYGDKVYPLNTFAFNVKLKKSLIWSFPLGGIVESSPCYANKTMFITCHDNAVYAFENLDQEPNLKWKKKLDPMALFNGNSAYANGILYVSANNGYFYAIDTQDGQKVARYKIEKNDVLKSSAVISEKHGVVIFSATDGKLYAFPLLAHLTDAWSPCWTFNTEKQVISSPIVMDYNIFVGSTDGFLYSIDIQSGSLSWKSSIGFPIASSPAATEEMVCVGANGYLYALDARKGSFLWQSSKLEGASQFYLLAHNDIIYCLTNDRKVLAFSKSGNLEWSYKTRGIIKNTPVVNNKGILYTGCYEGWLYAIDIKDGKLLWEYDLGEPIFSSPFLAEEKLFIIAKKVYTFMDN